LRSAGGATCEFAEFLQKSNFPELAAKSSADSFLEEWLNEVSAKRPALQTRDHGERDGTAVAKELYERRRRTFATLFSSLKKIEQLEEC